ncbi:MAG: hypothetical protein RL368_2457 [Pseudomonadota bacterium]|jgi:signal transduction histidine kinase
MTLETSKYKLLIVDDIAENISVLFEFLSKMGFKVLVAQDGKSAIQRAEYAQPDVILLDVMMPGIDGFETCRILKSQEQTRDIPIVFMTALADTVDKVKGFSLGAADYITKPIQHEEVLARINAQLNIRKLQQQLIAQNAQLQAEIDSRIQIENSLQKSTHLLETHTIELQRRNMELQAFSRTVAHDLKNPLNAIIGYTGMLLEESEEGHFVKDDFVSLLHSVDRSARKMVSIIQALLLLAGVAQHSQVEISPLNMDEIIEQTKQRLAYMLEEYRGEIILHRPWVAAKAYAPWVEEIVSNYVSNAMKYGGRPPRIEIGSQLQEDGMVRYWVLDNGQGLSPEAQAQLFTPFTRLHQDTAEGHGLGLSIVHQIVEKLGGTVGVESAVGQGSRFYFTLPAVASE